MVFACAVLKSVRSLRLAPPLSAPGPASRNPQPPPHPPEDKPTGLREVRRARRTPFGRGWLWFWSVVHSNSPLRPAAVDREGGQSERHRVSPPHARSWLCPHLPIDTHCTHVRAGLLLLRASVPRPRPAAPFPPCCLQHVPTARARRSRAPIQTTGWAGGKKLMTCHESTVSSCGFRSVLVWILWKCGVLKVLLRHGQGSCGS